MGFAWTALGVGVLAIVLAFIRVSVHSYAVPVFGITAISLGIRSLVRLRRAPARMRWAPIIAIVLGVVAEIILIVTLVVPQTTMVRLGPTTPSTNYLIGKGTLRNLPSSPQLREVAASEDQLVQRLQTMYPTTGDRADAAWPAKLIIQPGGVVDGPDGNPIGFTLPAGEFLAYNAVPSGGFLIEMSGSNTTEVAVYASTPDEYVAWCANTDPECNTGTTLGAGPTGTAS